tara:strand:+ start:192 stop:437 length:246 start_codon:yes stop_codon:yes gene_type:complete
MESLIGLVVIVLVAIGVTLSLLRHVIVLAFQLAVFSLLVIAGLWVWQHRADVVRLAEPYLSDAATELETLLKLEESREEKP